MTTAWEWGGQKQIRQFLAATGDDMLIAQMNILENLRDHVQCENPYVHLMIATNAGLRKDRAKYDQAIFRLGAFGPDFPSQVLPFEDYDDYRKFGDAVAKADVGLQASFNMLNFAEAKRPVA